MAKDDLEINATYVNQTARGVLVNIHGEEMWLPKSQVERISGEAKLGEEMVIRVPAWLAREKGID